ncbi:WXG100 family type VII secretion target [Amycolatopsis pigmentata]|uniref:WXG100 family type VII secretion target n=1 Tax=Amycolatopsis pigmentata TaxID=450801 RepID=A0ABW5G092_9PSEU
MVANDGFIKYNHDALHETVQQMFNANNQITQQMEDLENQVKANKELYLGSSSDQYGMNAQKIGNDLLESTERLHQVAGNVQDGSQELEDQDKHLAQLFQ